MRVALVCDWFLPRQGGIELHLRDLALALRAAGMDARVISTTRGAAEVDGVQVHRVPARLFPVGEFAFTPTALARLGRVLRNEQFDVVHSHVSVVSPVAYAGALSAARAGIPSIITFHSMLHGSAVMLGASEALMGWSRSRIVLSAVSSVVAAQAARWMPDASVGVLPNGIDTAFWRALPPARDGGEVVIATAMRLSRKKRPVELLRAVAQASRFLAGVPLRLVIAGDGPDRPALERLAAELGIARQVHFAGQLSRESLRHLYARANLFVLPSERESFGIAALEARAAGLPVIAMLASGARDFITPGQHGLLARDPAELSRFIARLALDAPLRDYMSHVNRSIAPPYDWRDVAALHREFYAAAFTVRDARNRANQP